MLYLLRSVLFFSRQNHVVEWYRNVFPPFIASKSRENPTYFRQLTSLWITFSSVTSIHSLQTPVDDASFLLEDIERKETTTKQNHRHNFTDILKARLRVSSSGIFYTKTGWRCSLLLKHLFSFRTTCDSMTSLTSVNTFLTFCLRRHKKCNHKQDIANSKRNSSRRVS